MNIPIFVNEPSILIQDITEIFPKDEMTYDQKINAIARFVILLSSLGFIFTMKHRFLIVGLITLALIIALVKFKNEPVSFTEQEGFKNLQKKKKSNVVKKVDFKASSEKTNGFKEGTKKNPFSNVLLTEIGDDPKRASAPPAFNEKVDEEITQNVKRGVQFMNPEIKSASKQLYGDLWDKMELDQSNRAFFSTANTQVMADQSAFSQFLYGDMISAKEQNAEGAIARTQDNARQRLY
jgi:hypothetical protein